MKADSDPVQRLSQTPGYGERGALHVKDGLPPAESLLKTGTLRSITGALRPSPRALHILLLVSPSPPFGNSSTAWLSSSSTARPEDSAKLGGVERRVSYAVPAPSGALTDALLLN